MDGDLNDYELITRNLQEVIGAEELRTLLLQAKDQKKTSKINVYWGTAATGRPHVAYFVPIIKLADMLHAGCHVTVLFADLHAYLDNMKAPWSLLRYRTRYYEAVIKAMLTSVGVPLEQLRFVRGADYQLTRRYSADVYRFSACVSVHDARKAGAEVVKQISNPLVSGLLYPALQALDEEHLGVDAQFGGVDQRKIFMLAEKYLARLGYRKRVHLMNIMVPGLSGTKMSSSEADSKIDLLDSKESVDAKLAGAVCKPGVTAADGNGLLAFMRYVVFPLANPSTGIKIPDGDKSYLTFEQLEAAYLDGSLTANTLRQLVNNCLNSRMNVIRSQFNSSEELTKLISIAYPEETKKTDLEQLTEAISTVSLGAEHHEDLETALLPIIKTEKEIPELTSLTEKEVLDAFEREFPGCRSKLALRTKALLSSASDQNLPRKCILRILWRIKPDSGLLHIGHCVPLAALARLSHLPGVHIILLIDNVAGHLRSGGDESGYLPWQQLVARGLFTQALCTATYLGLGGKANRMTGLLGSSFQLENAYMLDLYRVVGLVPESDCAATAALNISECDDSGTPSGPGSSSMGRLLLPCLQLVDTLRLGADVCLSGEGHSSRRENFIDKFILRYAEGAENHDLLSRWIVNNAQKNIHSAFPVHISHCLLPALQQEVSSSGETSSLLTPMQMCFPSARLPGPAATNQSSIANAAAIEEATLAIIEPSQPLLGIVPPQGSSSLHTLMAVKRRVKRAFCQPGNVAVNPCLDIYRILLIPHFVWQAKQGLRADGDIHINRAEKNGGPMTFSTFSDLCQAFASEQLHPGDLKPELEKALIENIANPIQQFLAEVCINLSENVNQLIEIVDLNGTSGAGGPSPIVSTSGASIQSAIGPDAKNISSLLDSAFPPVVSKKGNKKAKGANQTPSKDAAKSDQPKQQSKSTKPEIIPDAEVEKMDDAALINALDIRVGRIVSAKKHENADALYVETVDFGDPEGQYTTVVSGLVKYVPMEKLIDHWGVFIVNLKPVKMRGIESKAMLFCASSGADAERTVCPLEVPTNLRIAGLPLYFCNPSAIDSSIGQSGDSAKNVDMITFRKKLVPASLWSRVAPGLRVGELCTIDTGKCVEWKSTEWRLCGMSPDDEAKTIQWIPAPKSFAVGSTVG